MLVALSYEEMGAGFGAPRDAVFRSQKTDGPLSRSQLWPIVRKATRGAGIKEDVSPHWFRHAHAPHALDRGAPAHLFRQTPGHQSLATTSRYTAGKGARQAGDIALTQAGGEPVGFAHRFNLDYRRRYTSGNATIEAIRQVLDEETERRAFEAEKGDT